MFENLSERYTKIFERPAPVVSCDKEAIEAVSAPGFYDGYFIVKNSGGGNLEGDIFAGSSLISLSTQLIEGNDSIVEFEIDLRDKRPGEIFTSRIVLTTSGGLVVIPVKIEIGNYGIKCGRFKLRNLQDFAGCAQAIPGDAVSLFATPEFEKWLEDINCEHMEFYHKILADGGVGAKELDGFLTACGVKDRAAIRPKNKSVCITAPFGSAEIAGELALQCVSWGVFEYNVYTLGRAPWLRLSAGKITSSDFDGKDCVYKFTVEPVKITGEKAFETIVLENGTEKIETDIIVKKQKPFEASLSRLSYKSEDSGYLIITNNTNSSIMLEVAALEGFIRFKAAKYVVAERAEIPFEIKVNSFLNLGFGRKPINVSDIICRTVMDGRVYKETLIVKAGSLING